MTADCFWTDIVYADQDCGEDEPPVVGPYTLSGIVSGINFTDSDILVEPFLCVSSELVPSSATVQLLELIAYENESPDGPPPSCGNATDPSIGATSNIVIYQSTPLEMPWDEFASYFKLHLEHPSLIGAASFLFVGKVLVDGVEHKVAYSYSSPS